MNRSTARADEHRLVLHHNPAHENDAYCRNSLERVLLTSAPLRTPAAWDPQIIVFTFFVAGVRDRNSQLIGDISVISSSGQLAAVQQGAAALLEFNGASAIPLPK